MYRRVIAVVMSMLIIALPVCTSSAFASILSVEAYGNNGIAGVASGRGDQINFDVVLSETASPGQLRTDFPQESIFDACSGTRCSYKSEPNDHAGGKYEYNIILYSSDSLVIDSYTDTILIDAEAPEIEEFKPVQSSGSLQVTFLVIDHICPGCGSLCSGISAIRITENGVEREELNPGTCKAEQTVAIDNLVTEEGKVKICLEAVDHAGLASESCKEITVDFLAPEIVEESFNLMYDDGRNMTYVPQAKVAADASVYVLDPGLKKVTADFSSIGGEKDIEAQCVDGYCSWDGIEVGGEQAIPKVMVTAVDEEGMTNSREISLGLKTDKDEPVIKDIYTVKDAPELAVRKGLNRIFVVIDGSGAGYSRADVELDMKGFAGTRVKAEKCYQDPGNYWICEFEAQVNKPEAYRANIYASATDDALNSMTSDYSEEAVVDATMPDVSGISLSSECAVASEGLVIEIGVSDASKLFYSSDLSGISSRGTVKGTCDTGECEIVVPELYTAHAKETVTINITDSAGNMVPIEEEIEICESDTQTKPNFVSVSAGSPQPVDRRMLSFVSLPVHIPLSLHTTGNAVIMEKHVSCEGATSSYFLNKDSNEPIVSAKLPRGSVEDSTLECSLSLIVRKGGIVYQTAEEESFSVTVPFYNNQLGEIGESMQEKIDAVDSQISQLEEDIESWESWNKWLGILCSVAELMGNLNTVLQTLLEVHWAWTCPTYTTLNSNQYTKAAAEAIKGFWMTVCEFAGKFDKFVEGFFWPTNIVGSPPYIGAFVKHGCLIYSCRLCDASLWINVGLITAKGIYDSNVMVESTKTVVESETEHMHTMTREDVISTDRLEADYFWDANDYAYITTYKTESPKSESFMEAWRENGINTRITTEIDSDTWLFNPYKSIHYAKACMCIPGYIYNLKKERQIKCMYRTCLEQNAKVGLPTDTCDYAYKERQCLYVDSAQFKLHGYMGGLLDSFADALISQLPSLIAGLTHWATCSVAQKGLSECKTEPCTGITRVLCGLSSAAIMIMQIMDIMDNGLDFSKYDKALEGTDYCSGDQMPGSGGGE